MEKLWGTLIHVTSILLQILIVVGSFVWVYNLISTGSIAFLDGDLLAGMVDFTLATCIILLNYVFIQKVTPVWNKLEMDLQVKLFGRIYT